MTASNVFRLPHPATIDGGGGTVVGMYTPLWYAAKVLNTTAHSWWSEGIPPARKRSERATDAVVQVASSVVRHLRSAPPRPGSAAY
ncbi:hypothetical protein [Xylophilus ampelinus]|uniref:Uncharacterized protein n=1 Tax=Xylophilus ampelinus TaxID=54067 RepID=A0A318SHB2_9BURK|nr:hypothetical protein [Xylophilus ampelinus]MCS4511575.1 hypothetical protein [Xylophilus ampelinus]PYE74270.1 hypothetical protein DFQ15_12728 [Xylophilus ampelinus]